MINKTTKGKRGVGGGCRETLSVTSGRVIRFNWFSSVPYRPRVLLCFVKTLIKKEKEKENETNGEARGEKKMNEEERAENTRAKGGEKGRETRNTGRARFHDTIGNEEAILRRKRGRRCRIKFSRVTVCLREN